jgi:hypothetical protein
MIPDVFLFLDAFLASAVETLEALTIVLAVAVTRGVVAPSRHTTRGASRRSTPRHVAGDLGVRRGVLGAVEAVRAARALRGTAWHRASDRLFATGSPR